MDALLVLFDIDGTLVSAGDVSRRTLEEALRTVFGTAGPLAEYDFSGKTDPQIVRELMTGAGLPEPEIDSRLRLALDTYRARLLQAIAPGDVRPKPGVGLLLRALGAEPRVSLGLLTGNLEECARAKLAPPALNVFFQFGAYGSDDEDRYRLPRIARERAERATGRRFDGKRVVVVGDSIHDVRCGQSLGVRSVAVATGRTPPERLAQEAPDALLADLSDTAGAFEAITLARLPGGPEVR